MRNLLKAMLTTGGATVAAQVLGLAVNKILAHFIGAAGIGFYSLCRQVHDSATALGSVGTGGLLQGLAARQGAARHRLLRAALLLAALGTAVAVALLLLAPDWVARWLFDRTDHATLLAVRLCAGTAALAVAVGLLNGMVNAARAINTLAILALAGALTALLLAWPVALAAVRIPAAVLGLIAMPLLVQIGIALARLPRLGWRLAGLAAAGGRPGGEEFRYFARFAAFNVTLTAAGIGAMLLLRARVVAGGGLPAAGLFAAGWGVGMQSMSLLLSSFGTYVLPTVAAADPEQRRRVLQDAATLLLALSLPLLTALVLFKPLVLRILFTVEFLPAVTLLQWLLLGNFIKAVAWVAAVPFLAAADLRRYFVLEAGWYAVLAGGTMIAARFVDVLQAIGMAFVGAYLVYFSAALVLAGHRFGFRLSGRSLAVLAAGAVVLILAAELSWNDTTMRWPLALSMPVAAGLVALLALTPRQRAAGWLMLKAVARP